MRFLHLFVFATLIATYLAVTCPKAPNYVGQFIGPDCQCASGVQYLCSYSSVTLGLTRYWKRGSHVKELCTKGTPPAKFTPIATFLGPNNAYDVPPSFSKQHAAVFVGCNSTGITVYDQFCNTNKKWGIRVIKYTGKNDHNDAVNYYIVTK